jgi:hypothetical protein
MRTMVQVQTLSGRPPDETYGPGRYSARQPEPASSREGPKGLRTLRWRGLDSNPRSPGYRIFKRDRSDEPSSSHVLLFCQLPDPVPIRRERLAAQKLDAAVEHGSWPIRWHDRQTLRKIPLRLVPVAGAIGRQPLGEQAAQLLLCGRKASGRGTVNLAARPLAEAHRGG